LLQALAEEGVDLSYFIPAVYDDILKGFMPLEEGASFNLSQKSQRRVLSPASCYRHSAGARLLWSRV
jgi:hypothetical protein